MDITTLFKARLEVIKNRNKALGTITSPSSTSESTLNGSASGLNAGLAVAKTKSKLFAAQKSEYYTKAKELVNNISNLNEFLKETRAPYLNVESSTMIIRQPSKSSSIERAGENSSQEESSSSKVRFNPKSILKTALEPSEIMSDAEKDQIDVSVQKIIHNNQKRISEFLKLIEVKGLENNRPQLYIHLSNVINSISDYLKEVCSYYAEMKAIRVKRALDLQNISKITIAHHHDRKYFEGPKNDFKWKNFGEDSSDNVKEASKSPMIHEELDIISSMYVKDEFKEYTSEELQMFEEENSMLLNSLNTTADEVEQIESNVVHIAQLHEIFTEKVLLQDKEISQISNVVIGTTENIKGGNEQIRQAIQHSADFRAWILFFLIVMSLSLLFLDWYND